MRMGVGHLRGVLLTCPILTMFLMWKQMHGTSWSMALVALVVGFALLLECSQTFNSVFGWNDLGGKKEIKQKLHCKLCFILFIHKMNQMPYQPTKKKRE